MAKRGSNMTGPGCNKKHTPITTDKQKGLFGSEYARRKAGKKGRMSGISTAELKSHLQEAKGKDLPSVASSHYETSEGKSERDKFYKRKAK